MLRSDLVICNGTFLTAQEPPGTQTTVFARHPRTGGTKAYFFVGGWCSVGGSPDLVAKLEVGGSLGSVRCSGCHRRWHKNAGHTQEGGLGFQHFWTQVASLVEPTCTLNI